MSLSPLETRLLVLNADPVFNDHTLELLSSMDKLETHVVRGLSEAIAVLLEENFDAFIVEAEAASAVEQAVNIRQHFPSLRILCVVPRKPADAVSAAHEQNIRMASSGNSRRLSRGLAAFIQALEGASSTPA